ncbi:exopolyphosphatase / guanosine-5'-triphosphate,3'-diphosphate pyrophosphatase [Cohaesibacter sp. ES.047]|nr:Ppx/GppA phosphatase family protein [Cohaesibacter sp. ES.047]SNY92891.1 exopolyphosphatase / guanosine-5'-triphosphate,3'-diphosphate pyrophosphatase [Cohaesibacter sp. ES.047]
MSDTSRQGDSVVKSAEDQKSQQPGRNKKRRSRSKRRRGGKNQPPNLQQNGQSDVLTKSHVDAKHKPASQVSDEIVSSDAPAASTHEPDVASPSKKPHRTNHSGQSGSEDQRDLASTDGRAASSHGRDNSDHQSASKGQHNRSGKHNHQRQDGRTQNGAPVNGQRSGPSSPTRSPTHVPREQRQSYAALDLGTNNCRLLVAEPHGQSFRVVDAFSRIVRLGEGLSQTGFLSEDAQDRAIGALKVCQSKLSYRAVKRFRLIATEACRRAQNGSAFLQRVYRETGLKLEIVNRETEARLAVAGCASLVHPEADGVVLFDIGGGSSEIVWLDLDPLNDEAQPLPGEKRNRQTRRAMRHLSERIRCWASLQVGVVTLSEKHGGQLVTRDNFEAMVAEVREMLEHFEEREALAEAIKTKHIHMLGTSGTVTTLAGVHLGLERYDRRQVDGTWLTAEELRAMINRVLSMDFQERINNPCIGQDRADLVLAGCAILEAFHREWPCGQLRVADRGLREGILMEMMIDDGVWTQQPGKKGNGKKRRNRRRGGRGSRGGQSRQPASPEAE